MKAIIMFGGLILSSILLYVIYSKISIVETYFNLDNSPIWIDAIFTLFFLICFIQRGLALISKIF